MPRFSLMATTGAPALPLVERVGGMALRHKSSSSPAASLKAIF
jgi:hypothetical protein